MYGEFVLQTDKGIDPLPEDQGRLVLPLGEGRQVKCQAHLLVGSRDTGRCYYYLYTPSSLC